MKISQKVVDPFSMVIDIIPTTPSTGNENIKVINNSHIFRKISPRVVSEIDITFVVPGVRGS